MAGLRASEKFLTIFYVSSTLDGIASAVEVTGYAINGNIDDQGIEGAMWSDSEGVPSRAPATATVTRFESFLSGAIDQEHPFFFFDGIKAYYVSSRQLSGSDLDDVILCAEMVYRHCSPRDYAVTRPSSSIKNNNNNSPNRHRGRARDSMSMMRRILQSYADSSSLGERDLTISIRSNRVLELLVRLRYEGLDPRTMVDNRSYSNLVPSKQPYRAWSVSCSFNSTPIINFGTASLSGCVRRLLALYIISKCAPVGATVSSLREGKDSEGGGLPWDCRARATSIASVLSKETQKALQTLCNPSPQDKHSSIAQQSNFLEALFLSTQVGIRQESAQHGEQTDYCDPVCAQSAPFGSWLSLCAVMIGCLPGGLSPISEFWELCINQLRQSYHNLVADQTPPLFVKNVHTSPSLASVTNKGTRTPLLVDSLWGDVLERLCTARDASACMSLPDLTKSLVVQKLQLLQFCAAVKYEIPRCTPCSPKDSVINSIAVPELCRRSPETSDRKLQDEYVIRKVLQQDGLMHAHDVKHVDELSVVQVQRVQNPVLIADLRAFKAVNPSADMAMFCQWYGLPVPSVATSQCDVVSHLDPKQANWDFLPALWSHCEACPASEQRPLFDAETESEKCVSFFESMSPSQFAAEMLAIAAETLFVLLRYELQRSEGEELPAQNDALPSGLSPLPQIASLREEVIRVMQALRIDTPAFGADDHVKDSLSQPLLFNLDALCGHLEDMEAYLEKVSHLGDAFSAAAPLTIAHRNLLRRLAQTGEGIACNDEEGSIIYKLARHGEALRRTHDWDSTDARELGTPCSKLFFCDVPHLQDGIVAELDTAKGRMRISTKFAN